MNSKTATLLRKLACSHAGVTEGVACAGTKLEALTFNVGKKAFLFVSANENALEVRLKLSASLAEAQDLAAKDPDGFNAAAGGWTKLRFGENQPPAEALLKRWIGESYGLFAPKRKPRV